MGNLSRAIKANLNENCKPGLSQFVRNIIMYALSNILFSCQIYLRDFSKRIAHYLFNPYPAGTEKVIFLSCIEPDQSNPCCLTRLYILLAVQLFKFSSCYPLNVSSKNGTYIIDHQRNQLIKIRVPKKSFSNCYDPI